MAHPRQAAQSRWIGRWIGGYVCAPRSDGLDSEEVVKGASADQAVALVHASSPMSV
ncbi:hypothetical protein IG631_08218 [Alternaria alternata]|nr:hypothetical protein IG631_08218 [Alternaria alternata]